jgi:hypothetical protein
MARVLSFGPSSLVWWDVLRVEGRDGEFLVSRNWSNHNGGPLKVGEEVEFDVASKPVYSDCGPFVEGLRRVGKEASVVE